MESMTFVTNKLNSKQLIVVIHEDLANNSNLAQAIHWMGANENCSILYLVLVERLENMLTISRNMATMKAVTSANGLHVSAKTVLSTDWLKTLEKVIRPNDIIVCQEEQTVLNGRFKPKSLGDYLSVKFNNPIHTMSGYYHPVQTMAKKWIHELIGLMGILVILGVFTWLQINGENALDDPYASIYIMITFIIEMGLVIVWHKFIFR
jgi:hypothetical protein